jgi:hypothetical protein
MFRPVFGGYPNLPIGEEEMKQNSTQLKIYPNPAIDYINFLGVEDVVDVKVYSLQGKLMLQQQITNGEKLNVLDIPRGLYILYISDRIGNVSTQKISVVH